jgi:hypothetical protein
MKRRISKKAPFAAAALIAAALVSAPNDARAFCGFYVAPNDAPLYNDASMVALMRDGTRTVMSMSNNYKGPATDFAMVVPVPVVLKKENVKTLPHDIFHKLEALSAPRLVEYWEQDPCHQDYEKEDDMPYPSAPAAEAKAGGAADKDYGVKIEAKFTVGEYQVVVLSANESDGLERWLHDNKYNIPKGASSALAPYIKEQQKFFVAKIDIKKVQVDAQGVAVLSPLRFNFESQDFRLPVRLGLLNAPVASQKGVAGAKQDLLVFVLAMGKRYEVANYPNVTIPTNLDVTDSTREAFGPFYATLFDATLAKAGGKAVITEYAWETSSCDPCPTPPLDPNDVATLGGDVLYGQAAGESSSGDKSGGYYGGAYGVVLTRLHTRYDQSTLSEDLVFRAAEPIVGGREFVVGANGQLEKGSRPDSANNFQGRYAIRHRWTGAINCANPRRNVWGGPPSGDGYASPMPATNLAAAPRGNLKLADHVTRGLDDVDGYDRALSWMYTGNAGPPPARATACGCSVPGNGRTTWMLGAGIAVVATIGALVRRRRR